MLKTVASAYNVFTTVLASVVVFGGLALADPAVAGFIGKHPAVDTVAVVILHLLRALEQTLTGTTPQARKGL